MQAQNFFDRASFALFLVRCCFCLCNGAIISGSCLIFGVFCCLINFFWRHINPNLLLVCCWQKWQSVDFYWLGEFCASDDFLLLLIRLHAWIVWALVHVLCGCYPSFDFFGHACQDMMCREISRPPGPTNHPCLPPPVPSLAHFVVIVRYCTHMHPYTPNIHPHAPYIC